MRVIALFALFLVFAFPVYAQKIKQTPAKQALLLDFETGQVLFEKNSDQRMPTSSMSKVMTMYAIFEALKEGRISLNETFYVSEKAWKKGGSKMFVEAGTRVKIEDLIKGVIVQSGNDATIVLAEGLSGSEDEFAKLITERAQAIGMDSSNFVNASGWPEPNHYSTAKDLSVLARRIIEDFPEYYGYYSIKEFEYNGIKQRNRNPLLFKNIGVDGIKTGHTEIAGYGLIASGERDGRRVILVVNGLDSTRARSQESARLMEWGLKGFVNQKLVNKGTELKEIDVALGARKTVSVGTAEDIHLTLPLLDKEKAKIDLEYKTPLPAPIQKGDVVGTAKAVIPGYEKPIEYDLVALENVSEAGFFKRGFAKTKMFFFGG